MPEINLILDKARDHNYRNYLILFLLLRTGRRIGELIELRAKDISFEREMILWNIEKKHKRLKDEDGNFVKHTDKYGKERYKTEKINLRRWKPLDKIALRKLEEYVKNNDFVEDDYIFPSPYDSKRHISRIAVWIFLSKYAKELNIEIHPHSFRHSFAISVAQKIKSPMDLKKLSDLLEHSSIQVTEGYMQFAPEEAKKLLEDTFNND